MPYGLNFFPPFRLGDMPTAEYFDQVLRLSERADELGYTAAKAVEHYFHDYGGQRGDRGSLTNRRRKWR